jgi:hypothetical protein
LAGRRHLDHNRLISIRGLGACGRLRELTISHQRGDAEDEYGAVPPPEGGVEVDAETVAGLAGSLRVLDASGNGMRTARALGGLGRLEVLLLSDNRLGDLGDVVGAVSALRRLEKLDARGNPVCGDRSWGTSVIAVSSDSLCEINGKEIAPVQREFVVRLEMKKRGLLPPSAAPSHAPSHHSHHTLHGHLPTAGGFGKFALRRSGAEAVASAMGFGPSGALGGAGGGGSFAGGGGGGGGGVERVASIPKMSSYAAPGGRPLKFDVMPPDAAPMPRGERGITPGADWSRPPPPTPWGAGPGRHRK